MRWDARRMNEDDARALALALDAQAEPDPDIPGAWRVRVRLGAKAYATIGREGSMSYYLDRPANLEEWPDPPSASGFNHDWTLAVATNIGADWTGEEGAYTVRYRRPDGSRVRFDQERVTEEEPAGPEEGEATFRVRTTDGRIVWQTTEEEGTDSHDAITLFAMGESVERFARAMGPGEIAVAHLERIERGEAEPEGMTTIALVKKAGPGYHLYALGGDWAE